MGDKLKPCPFCGGENVSSNGMAQGNLGVIFCNDCGCFGPHPSIDMIHPKPSWNTRAADADLVEALRHMSTALHLLNSMVLSGESHSDISKAVYDEANAAIAAYEGKNDEST